MVCSRTLRSSSSTMGMSSSTRTGSTMPTRTMVPCRLSLRSAFRSVLFPERTSFNGRSFLLTFDRTYPTTEHPSDFVDGFLEDDVFFRIECFRFFHQPDEQSNDIEFYADFSEYGRFSAFFTVSRFKEELDHIEHRTLRAFVNSVTVGLRDDAPVLVELFVQLV